MCLNILKLFLRLLLLSSLTALNLFGQGDDRWIKWGSYVEGYEVGGDPSEDLNDENVGFIKSQIKVPNGEFGILKTNITSGKYSGQRLKLSAFIKTDEVKGWAGLWMRIDGPSDTVLASDNMQTRPIKGTTDWKSYSVVLDVATNADSIAYGILLVGEGAALIGNLSLEIVSGETEITEVPDKWVLFKQGNYKDAAKLFGDNVVDEDIYNINGELIYYENYEYIYYYLSLCRSGEVEKATEFIQNLSNTLKEDKWINPVVHYYSGKIDAGTLLRATDVKDEKERKEKKCEAYYFIGMNYLLKQDTIEAKNYFEKCIATNVKDYIEYGLAEAELKRIQE